MAVWVKRQALDTQHWTDTSSELLQNEEIRSTVADYLVDQLFANVDISGEIQSALPKELKPLAGPATGGLRNVATEAANKALEDPRVQDIWVDANRITHQQFVNLIEDKNSTLTINGNAVILDLAPLVTKVANRAGLGSDVGAKLPAGIAKVTVIQSDDVKAVQTSVRLLEDLVLVLAILVPLSVRARDLPRARPPHPRAHGRRLRHRRGRSDRQDRPRGDRRPGRQQPVLHGGDRTDRPGDLDDRDVACWARSPPTPSWVGVPLIIAAWLGGRSRPAVALRRAAAPWLRDRPDISWGVLAAVVLLFLLIVDVPATRQPIPVLVIIGLFVLGMLPAAPRDGAGVPGRPRRRCPGRCQEPGSPDRRLDRARCHQRPHRGGIDGRRAR